MKGRLSELEIIQLLATASLTINQIHKIFCRNSGQKYPVSTLPKLREHGEFRASIRQLSQVAVNDVGETPV